MGIENFDKSFESQNTQNTDEKQNDIDSRVSEVKSSIDRSKDARKSGELESQVGPVLESVGIPENRIEDVVDKLIKLGKVEITKFINKLKSYLDKENKKSLIDGLIQRLDKRSIIKENRSNTNENRSNTKENRSNTNENRSNTNENKEDIKEENKEESKNNKDIKEETKIEKENQNNTIENQNNTIENQNNTIENQNNTKENQNNTKENQNNTKENQNNTKENKEDINLKKEKKEGNINNTTEYKKFQKNFQNLEKIASSLSNNEQYNSYLSVLSDYKGKEINETNRKEIITRLKQALSPKVLTNIVKDLGVNTKEYRDFKTSLISIEGGEGGYFRSQFEMIEQVGVYNFPHPLTPSPLEERGEGKNTPLFKVKQGDFLLLNY